MFGENKRDNFYFDSFIKQCDFFCRLAAKTQEKILNFDYADLKTTIEELHEVEHAADQIQHEITEKLAKEFLAPLEREDIVTLAQELDNLVDDIEDIMITVYEYDIREFKQPALDYMKIINEAAEKLRDLMSKFSNFKKDSSLLTDIIDINNLEADGDVIYRDALRDLFVNEHDAKVLISWKELYYRLERVMDATEDLANQVETIIMKNS